MRIRALLIIAAAAAVTAGCGSGEPAVPLSQAGRNAPASSADTGGRDDSGETFVDLTDESSVDVQARDNAFVKPYIEVKAGTKVTFTNRGRNQHDVQPNVTDSFAAIPATDFQPKDSDEITFAVPGDYPYYCSLHGTPTKGMIGTIRVLQ